MPTPLYPTFEKRISDAVAKILHDQIEPWAFFNTRLEVKRFDGRIISYSGISFEGSPRQVFWSNYIEPFLENLVVNELTAGVVVAKERGVNTEELLPEIQGLLTSSVSKVLARMALIDRRLRGNGFPEQVSLRSTDSEYTLMAEFIAKHVQAELSMSNIKPAKVSWLDRHKTLAWAIGIIVTVAGLVAKFL